METKAGRGTVSKKTITLLRRRSVCGQINLPGCCAMAAFDWRRSRQSTSWRGSASSTQSAKQGRPVPGTRTGRSSDDPGTRCCAAGRSRDTRRTAPIHRSELTETNKRYC